MTTKVVVCGEKEVCVNCLNFLYESADVEICMVVGSKCDWQADIPGWAVKRRIPVETKNINTLYEKLSTIQPDFIISIQYRRRLCQPILDLARHGAINLHFSLLPRYGGCYPIAWSILNGETEAGVTMHLMVETFDQGDVLAQQSVAIGSDMTARELFDVLSTAAVSLFRANFPKLQKGSLVGHPQNVERRLYYSAGSIDFEKDNFINWTQDAEAIHRKVRAFTFPPLQFSRSAVEWPHGKEKVLIGETKTKESDIIRAPGSTIGLTKTGGLQVATGNGILIIGKLDSKCPKDFVRSLSCKLQDICFHME